MLYLADIKRFKTFSYLVDVMYYCGIKSGCKWLEMDLNQIFAMSYVIDCLDDVVNGELGLQIANTLINLFSIVRVMPSLLYKSKILVFAISCES
jgi:hypothetical protein